MSGPAGDRDAQTRRDLFEAGWQGASEGLQLAACLEDAATVHDVRLWAPLVFGHHLYHAAQRSNRVPARAPVAARHETIHDMLLSRCPLT